MREMKDMKRKREKEHNPLAGCIYVCKAGVYGREPTELMAAE